MRFTTVFLAAAAVLLPSAFALPANTVTTAAPVTTTTAPVTTTAAPVTAATMEVNACSPAASPAYKDTKAGFTAFKLAEQYLIAAILNDKATHDQLIAATKGELKKVLKLYDSASVENDNDPDWFRRDFFKVKLGILRTEIRLMNRTLQHDLPSFPWLGKAVNWIKTKWTELKTALTKFFSPSSSSKTAPVPGTPEHPATAAAMPSSHEEVVQGEAVLAQHDDKLGEIDEHIKALEKLIC